MTQFPDSEKKQLIFFDIQTVQFIRSNQIDLRIFCVLQQLKNGEFNQ